MNPLLALRLRDIPVAHPHVQQDVGLAPPVGGLVGVGRLGEVVGIAGGVVDVVGGVYVELASGGGP